MNIDAYLKDYTITNGEKRIGRGASITVLGQLLQTLLLMISFPILGRLLSPQEFGIVGMVAIIVNFLHMFKDLGLSYLSIQKDKLSQDEISSYFWMNIAISLFLALILFFSSGLIAKFYNYPQLKDITKVLSISLLIGGFSAQHLALLKRTFNYSRAIFIQVFSAGIGLGIAVYFAYSGYSYWALIFQQVSIQVLTLILSFSLCKWRPSFIIKMDHVKNSLSFSGHITFNNLTNFLSRNLDKVLIGKYFGGPAVGLYEKATQLLILPLQQINAPLSSVGISSLSRMNDDKDSYYKTYTQLLLSANLLAQPVVFFLIIMAKPIVSIALGPQWLEMAPIFSILGFAAFTQVTANTTSWLFISQKRTKDLFHWSIISSILTFSGFALGIYLGDLISFSVVYTINSMFIKFPILIYMSAKSGPVHHFDIFKLLAKTLFVNGIIGLCLYFVSSIYIEHFSTLVALIYSAISFALFIIIFYSSFSYTRQPLLKFIARIKSKLKSKN